MARPQAFNKDQALQKAMLLFWKKGYHQSSLQELLSTMHIKRSSFYNSFGSKEAIFKEAVKLYQKENVEPLRKEVENMNSAVQVLKNIVSSNLKRASLQDERTCLVFRSVLELTDDTEEKQEVKKVYDQILHLYKAVMEKAQQEGTVDKSKNPDILARYFYSSLNGLRLMANIENSPDVLKPMADQILSNIIS